MGKKHFMGMLAAGAAALLSSTVPAGCTDDRDNSPSAGGKIGFAVELWQEGDETQTARTKGAGVEAESQPADTLPRVSVIALEGDSPAEEKPLYLHAVITDGIEADGSGNGTDGSGIRTKAAPVNDATMYDEMSVTAFVYPAADSWPAAYTGGTPSADSYMRTLKVKKSEAWGTSYYWPGAARRISFFASAPYGSPGLTAFNAGGAGVPPYLSYAVPAAVADQKDLLVAASTDRPGNSNTAEPLTMKHALTAVRFVTGDDMLPGTVQQITLNNVYGAGKLPMQASPAWYDHGTTGSFTQTLTPASVAPDPQVPDTELTPAAATFMMLPQTLPAGAQIEVKYTDKLTGTQRTLTADIAGKTWPMGKTITYRISTSSIVVTPTLTVTAPAEFTYQGGNDTYTVTSSVVVTRPGDPTKTLPVPWTVEYSTDNGANWSSTKPAWLTAFTESGAGSSSPSGDSYTVTVGAQTAVTNHPQNAALQAAAPVNDGTNTNIYDLSTKGGTAPMRTANCYIVNAPGRYKLPLVYGNAVDYVKVPGGPNPGWNASAYTSTASGGNVLNPFINHAGTGITDPYIYTNLTPANCTLVWQDEPNLVTNVALSSDNHFLEFNVNQATIKQGNAVVAVKGTETGNPILWSWHIWVTDYKPGVGDKTITNNSSPQKHYTIMPVNLGWCDGPTTTYDERTVQVRFKQTGTGATQIITVKQKAHNITLIGNNTYFQFGRKDPFAGAILDGSTTKNKTWYDASGTPHTNENPPVGNFSTGNACITSGITQPNTFCVNNFMDNTYANLWSANNTVYTANDNDVVKTIYDPCPVGYKLPPNKAFTGFTTTGNNTYTQSQFNVQGAWNNGWNFYCNSSKTETVFFPASGWRHYYSAVPQVVGNLGFYWSAVPGYTNNGWSLNFNQSSILPLSPYSNRSYGLGVRAAQE
ncbi:Uncharacterised protein [Bacteroides heparinolyticus]|uniref:Fimbrillin family protein n=1 Tax=Prevotella heparinolytica TaxID=28113 RepID=A0A449I4R6_9BACE|nr:fimbrillin family protein [Bacteroides heparinolyticus]VFB14421.1 Uncharacterised protein [Bacteroides heparinolyticus]